MKNLLTHFSALLLLLIGSSSYSQEIKTLWDIEVETASKQAETLFDAPLGATVITNEEIVNSGATNIMEALRLVPGVIVRETTPGNYDIHIRGYDAIDPNAIITLTSNTTTLIMVNNRPVYSEFQGQTYWELLHIGIDDVEKIEVVRGPASAMYGSNAVTGVINILTREPDQEEKEGFYASTYSQTGNYNTILANAAVGYKMDNGLSIRASGNFDMRDRHFEDYYVYNPGVFVDELSDTIKNQFGLPLTNPDLPPTNPPNINIDERFPDPSLATDRYSFNGHAKYQKNDLELNLMGGYSDAEVQRVYAHNQVTALSHDVLTNTFGHFWGEYKNLSFSADYSDGDNEVLGSGNVLNLEYEIFNSKLEYNFELTDRFSLRPGLAYRQTTFNGMALGSTILNPQTYEVEELDGDQTNSATSGYLQAEYKTDKFRLIGALRGDMFEYPDVTKLSPLIISTYKLTDDFLIRGSFGQSFRTPFMFDQFLHVNLRYPHPQTPNTFVGIFYRGTERADDIPVYNGEELELLTITDAEIGFRHKISETFSLDIELFWSKLNNLTTTGSVYDTVVVEGETVNVNNYISVFNIDAEPTQTGATMSIFSQPFDNMDFSIFVTVQETKVNDFYEELENGEPVDADGDGKKFTDFYVSATPNFIGGVNFNYRPMEKWNFNINSYFYDHQTLTIYGTNTEIADSHIIFNSKISYEIMDGFEAFVNARNLIDNKRQYAFGDKIGTTILGGINVNID